MMTESGIIEKISNQKALVRIQKTSACDRCGCRDSCGVLSDNKREIEVKNDLKASVGDVVEISIPERQLMKLSMIVYLTPILALVLGAVLGGMLAEKLDMSSEPMALLCGAVSLVVAFVGVKRFGRQPEVVEKYHPRMTRILTRSAPL
jgi:sigma-E factor negative regulatory protein RseC